MRKKNGTQICVPYELIALDRWRRASLRGSCDRGGPTHRCIDYGICNMSITSILSSALSSTLRWVVPAATNRYNRRCLLLRMHKIIEDSLPIHQVFVRTHLRNLTVI